MTCLNSVRWLGVILLVTAVYTTALAQEDEKPVPSPPIKVGKDDWPWWRGPSSNGVAEATQKPPVKWSATENVLWKTPIPGRGHSSPTVVGDRVYIATAEEDREIQSVLCFDRQTGKEIWRTPVHTGKFDKKGNKKTTQASSSVACDGQKLYVNFLNDGAVFTTALDLGGQQVWQTKVSEFKTHQGFGSSPLLFQDFVYVTTDSPAGGVLACLRRSTGDIVWKHDRPQKANYASPVIYRFGGRDELLVCGCDLVSSFAPLTGKSLWEVEGATTECVTSIVTDGERIFVSGGYPRNHVQAINADGSGKTAWENGARVYVPSMVVHQGHLYAVLDNGVATCWESSTGKKKWDARVGGTFTSSLVLAGDTFYATNEAGKSFVFKADPEKFTLVGENTLGSEVYATPAICGGRIYQRVVETVDGKRQEVVYCLGEK